MERRLISHWWNRSHGTSTRCDLWLYDLGDGYEVAWREGRDTGKRPFGRLEIAETFVRWCIAQDIGHEWRDITDTHKPSPMTLARTAVVSDPKPPR